MRVVMSLIVRVGVATESPFDASRVGTQCGRGVNLVVDEYGGEDEEADANDKGRVHNVGTLILPRGTSGEEGEKEDGVEYPEYYS
jgi:hypothetical protein